MNLTQKAYFPVLFMFIIGVAASSVLIGFNGFTAERVKANEQIAIERAVLESLGIEVQEKASTVEVHRVFQENVRQEESKDRVVYVWEQGGMIKGYSIEAGGQGFWAAIKGFIGVEPDKRAVLGISFYEQNETPGLGAQIETYEFRSQFKGRKIAESGKALEIRPVSATLGENDVHAVTGATQTSTRLEKIINDALEQWRGGDTK